MKRETRKNEGEKECKEWREERRKEGGNKRSGDEKKGIKHERGKKGRQTIKGGRGEG